MENQVTKSWFCVFNNPSKHGYDGTPEEIVERIIKKWIENEPQRSCAVAYCVSQEGLHHLHAVFEDIKAMRFSTIKKVYPSMHIEPTKGNKQQAEDYINKKGKYAEVGEKIIYSQRHGEIKGAQGQRRDLSVLEELIEKGITPNEIMDMSLSYRRYDKLLKDAYYRKRWKETPVKREIKVYWHIGKTGTGKSYEMVLLSEEHGENEIYIVTDYSNGFDKYNGEKILFMDEFRGQMQYNQLLTILDGYRTQIKCRYTNAYALWTEVHITSPLPPEKLYEKMVTENRSIDNVDQLLRRISYIVHHKIEDGEHKKEYIEAEMYKEHNEIITKYLDAPEWVKQAEIQMKIEEK